MYRSLGIFSVILISSLGLPEPQDQGRIVGGQKAKIENFPYQVALSYAGVFACAATILNEEWTVTAAHCVSRFDTSKVEVRAGSSSRDSGGTVHKAVGILTNPNYDGSHNYDGDIALVKVSPPFEFGTQVQAITLIDMEPQKGDVATVSGWGAEEDGDILSPDLKFVSISIVSHEECETDYDQRGGITSNMICAGVPEGGKDACTGDVGGALTVEGKLAGIVSFGINCGDPDYPGVYTNVIAFTDFILKNIS